MLNSNFAPGGGASPQGIPTGLPSMDLIRANFYADLERKLGLRTLEWLYAIPFQMTVPAGGGDTDDVSIKQDAHFECFFITGDFTTLALNDDDPPVTADDGANHISIRITDGSNDLKLMNDFIPANLFLSPGRQLSPGVSGNPSNQLFYPFPFYHIFPANGAIQIEMQNNSDVANVVNLLFWGKKLRARIGDAAET